MKGIFLALACSMVFFPIRSVAQPLCDPNPPARILLVGDSWSEIMWENKLLRNALNKKGYGDWTEQGERTALTGSTASLWADPAFQGIVRDELLGNPELQVVVLLTGGNDFLAGKYANGWFAGQSPQDQQAFFDRTESYIRKIIANIEVTRPGIKILICGYDYLNLVNTLNEPANLLTWDNLGQPSARQINDALTALEQRKVNIANSDPDVYYVQNLGRMQNKYGYPGFFGPKVAPLPGNLAPAYTPFPGGFPDFPTPTKALGGEGTDPIHLNEEGYADICNALFDWFFSPIFKAGVNASYKSKGLANDGFVRPNKTKGTANLRMGRDAAGNYKNIISFATGALPDNAIINKASIFLTRSGSTLIGLPKQLDKMACQLDIKKGYFGTKTALEPADYTATSSVDNIGCFVGSAASNGGKIRIDIDPSALGFINTKGNTQFRFFINEALNGTTYTSFYDGDAAIANKPLLEIAYSLPGRQEEQKLFIENKPSLGYSLFPNPLRSGGILHILAPASADFLITDILGKTCLLSKVEPGENNIFLPEYMMPGIYFINFIRMGQTESMPFIISH